MINVKKNVIKEEQYNIYLDNTEIEMLIRDYCLRQIHRTEKHNCEIKIEDQSEGSPSYKVGIKAFVKIIFQIE